MESNNLDRLREAGLIRVDDLPQEYQAVVDGLTGDEVDVLLSVKQRLDEADVEFEAESPPDPPFTAFMTF